jgi:hypothetical protein
MTTSKHARHTHVYIQLYTSEYEPESSVELATKKSKYDTQTHIQVAAEPTQGQPIVSS